MASQHGARSTVSGRGLFVVHTELAVAEVRRLSQTGVLRVAKPKGEADKLVLYPGEAR